MTKPITPSKTTKPSKKVVNPNAWMVKTFEEACKILKLDPKKVLPVVPRAMYMHRKALHAQAKLIIIARVINEGWTPDWNDSNWKYWPYFWMDSPGFRFDASGCATGISYSAVGSRLCFKTRERSDYAGKTFTALYRDVMVLD